MKYALTFNINPHLRVNGKLWRTYPHYRQVSLLPIILNEHCSEERWKIDYKHFSVELCPKLNVMHVHTVVSRDEDISGPPIDDLCSRLNYHYGLPGYNACYVTPVGNLKGWADYITKDYAHHSNRPCEDTKIQHDEEKDSSQEEYR